MNRIDTTQVVDPSVLQPFTAKSLKFLQDAVKQMGDAAAATAIGDVNLALGYSLYKCGQSGTVIEDGYAYYNGEIYAFVGDDIVGYSDDAVVILEITNDPTADPTTFSDTSSKNVHNIRKLTVVDQVSGTGLFDYADMVFTVKRKVIEIGDWDMDATSAVNVAHGIADPLTKIRNFSVMIRGDVIGNGLWSIYRGGYAAITAVNVNITRDAAGLFDSTSYDSTGYNRGWITIEYVD